jgi:NADPH:quinone reductase-like Zn-dependent oxidoreductase
VIVDAVGGYSGARCRAMLVPGGRHVMVAGESPASAVQNLVPPFTSRSVLGVSTRARLAAVVDAVHKGLVRVNIVKRFPLASAEEAHALSQGGRLTGKVILNP